MASVKESTMDFEVKITYGGRVHDHIVRGETPELADMAAETVAKSYGGTVVPDSLRPATVMTATPTYALRGIKTFKGMEGIGLNATLYRDGKRVCEIIDEANGGEWHWNWFDFSRGESAEDAIFQGFIEAERAKIPADAVDKDYPQINLHTSFRGETWANKEVTRFESAKHMKREFRTYTCFQVGAGIGGETFKRVKGHGPEVLAFINKKYGAERIVIMNDQPEWK